MSKSLRMKEKNIGAESITLAFWESALQNSEKRLEIGSKSLSTTETVRQVKKTSMLKNMFLWKLIPQKQEVEGLLSNKITYDVNNGQANANSNKWRRTTRQGAYEHRQRPLRIVSNKNVAFYDSPQICFFKTY